MTSRAEAAESLLVPPPSSEEQARELQRLADAQQRARAQIAVLEGDIRGLDAEVVALGAAKDASAAEALVAEEEHADSVPRVQHSISLYATISGIRWDYSKEDVVAGVVNTATEVRAFELDPKTTNRFEITAALWGMIDPQER